MATLKEMRRWAQGEHVQGLPPRQFKATAQPAPALKRTAAPTHAPDPIELAFSGMAAVKTKTKAPPPKKYGKPKYKISSDGTDALIQFGKHRGQKLSDIADKDPSYCDFIIRDEFPLDLKDVARHQKAAARDRARHIKLFEEDDE